MKITSIRKCKIENNRTVCNEKPTKGDLVKLAKKIDKELKRRGLRCSVETSAPKKWKYTDEEGVIRRGTRTSNVKGNTIAISGCILTDEYVKKYGRNVNGYSGRRSRYLSWEDWVEFNDAVNDVLDENRISANAQSLAGQFVQRHGLTRMTRDDWEGGYHRNVGSMINPISRGELYESEGRGREGWREDQEEKKEKQMLREQQQQKEIEEKYPSVRSAKAHKMLYGRY
jgi:hypothetical protein